MDLKGLRSRILGGSLARRVVLRLFALATAISVFPLLQILSGNDPVLFNSVADPYACDMSFVFNDMHLLDSQVLKPIWGSFVHKEDVNMTTRVVRELMGMQMLDSNVKALCVGKGSASAVYALRELGFHNACGVRSHPFFSVKHKTFLFELEYEDSVFDFVLSGDLDKASVPAILMLEIERVLRPSGIGAILVSASGMHGNNLIRSATSITPLLKNSDVVHVGPIGEFTLVVFKKRLNSAKCFEQFSLLPDCQSINTNKPFMKYLEPLVQIKQVGFEEKIAYLPKFVDMSSRKRLVYVDIGAGEYLNDSDKSWFLPHYPVDHEAFNVYFVDHNTSVLLFNVKKPGVTFVYYPGLAGNKVSLESDDEYIEEMYVGENEFDFLTWFEETVHYADFVVLKMKAGEVEMKFLDDLFRTGTICSVDELFLSCPKGVGGNTAIEGGCTDLFKSLRSSGVFVHQWWGE